MQHVKGRAGTKKARTLLSALLFQNMTTKLLPAAHFGFEVHANLFEKLLRGHPRLIGANQDGEILGHMAIFDGLDADFLERFCKARDVGCFVKLAAEF